MQDSSNDALEAIEEVKSMSKPSVDHSPDLDMEVVGSVHESEPNPSIVSSIKSHDHTPLDRDMTPVVQAVVEDEEPQPDNV